MLRRSLIAAVALSVTLVSGCADTPRIPPADPTPTSAPLFSSDEEALAAATAVYEEYLAVVDAHLTGETTNLDLVSQVADGELVFETVADIEEFRDLGWTASTPRRVADSRLQSVDPTETTGQVVALYVCEDIGAIEVVDSDGNSVVREDRAPFTPFEVGVQFDASAEGKVVVRKFWDGGGICPQG